MHAGFHCSFGAHDLNRNLGDRQVLKKMQNQAYLMPETDLTQGLVNRRSFFFRKRRLLGFLKIFKLLLLGPLPGYIAANSIHRNAMGDGVEPRAQRAGILKLSNVPQHFDPHLLKHVEPTILITGQTGRIVEQRPFLLTSSGLECLCFARLATECDPLIGCTIFVIHVPSLIMSKEKHPRFNSIV